MTAAAAYRKTIHKCARVIESTFYDLHRKGQKENLHEFRLAVKRLRALLPSLPSPPSSTPSPPARTTWTSAA
ncbi:MAG TPA: hypothetical protein PKX74_05355, partial [Leptospiraceae bacterium]|nr:hypothetical protein [Leptospiraceae bacterium]